jgi:hypothetical protein
MMSPALAPHLHVERIIAGAIEKHPDTQGDIRESGFLAYFLGFPLSVVVLLPRPLSGHHFIVLSLVRSVHGPSGTLCQSSLAADGTVVTHKVLFHGCIPFAQSPSPGAKSVIGFLGTTVRVGE